MEKLVKTLVGTYFNKIILVISSAEIIIMLFVDYIISSKLGINIPDKFLTSYNSFVLNIFSVESFTVIFLFVLIFLMYTIFFPLILPTVIFKIIDVAYIAFEIIILLLRVAYRKTLSIFGTTKITEYSEKLEDMFLLLGLLKRDENGKIIKNDKSELIFNIYEDMSSGNKAYNFCVRVDAFFASAFLIAHYFPAPKYIEIIIGICFFISLFLSYCGWKMLNRLDDLRELVKKLNEQPEIPSLPAI